MAKLTFYGATEGVTGSSYILETGSKTILLDCGLFQGSREEEKSNKEPFQFEVKKIDAVVLSHAILIIQDAYRSWSQKATTARFI